MQILNNLQPIIDKYDYFIIDLWGVLYDGSRLYSDTIYILKNLKKHNKKVVFFSNSSQRSTTIKEKLAKLGVNKDLYLEAITAGELTYQYLALNAQDYLLHGKNYVMISNNSDDDLLMGLPYTQTDFNNADFILLRHFPSDKQLLQKILASAKSYNLTMICANPDLEAVDLEGNSYMCAGLAAKYYEEHGGKVIYFGKPITNCYSRVFEIFQANDLNKIIAIGDNLATDIKGGNTLGIDTILMLRGIHNEVLKQNGEVDFKLLRSYLEKYQSAPTYLFN